MADNARATITINAEPKAVMDVIADFPAYPQWAGVERTEVLDPGEGGRARRVRLWVDAKIVKDEYVLDYDWDDDRAVTWNLVEGKQQSYQRGTYALRDLGGRTEVTYDLTLEMKAKLPGLVRRTAQSTIMDRALRGLKKRVES